jgi:hypothetical protein
MTPSLAGVWTLVSVGLLGVAIATVALIYLVLGRHFSGGPAGFLLWPAALLITLPLHELVHAVFVVLYGGRPRFGAGVKGGMPYLYVTDPGRRFGRNQFLEIALAPLVLIDLGALILLLLQPAWTWAAVALVVNTSGAIGDLWVFALVLRFPASALVEDRTLGFAVWPSPGQQAAELRRHAPRHRVPAPGWLAVWLIATVASLVALPIPVAITMNILLPGVARWPATLGVIVLSGVMGSLAAFAWSRRRSGRR